MGGIAILALGWFLGVSPKLQEMTLAQESAVATDAQNLATQATTAQLKADFENLPAVSAELAKLRKSIPATADYTGFLNELSSIVDANDALLTGFTPSASIVLTAGAAPAAPPAEGEVATELQDGTLVAIPTMISASGSLADLLGFVDDLQHSTRLYLVGSLSFNESTDLTGSFTVSVDGYAYVVIDSAVADPSEAVDNGADSDPTGDDTLPTQEPVDIDLPDLTGDDESATPDPTETPAP
jgi:Tfp pilus assembly protein PilO